MQDLETAAQVRRTFQQRLNDPVILSFAPLPDQDTRHTAALPHPAAADQVAGGLPEQAEAGLVLQWSAVKAALPLNVQLITLKAMPEGSVLLRLAHLYQVMT